MLVKIAILSHGLIHNTKVILPPPRISTHLFTIKYNSGTRHCQYLKTKIGQIRPYRPHALHFIFRHGFHELIKVALVGRIANHAELVIFALGKRLCDFVGNFALVL